MDGWILTAGWIAGSWKAVNLTFKCTFLLFGFVIHLIGCARFWYHIPADPEVCRPVDSREPLPLALMMLILLSYDVKTLNIDDIRQQVELLTQRMYVVHMHRHDDDATVMDENPFGGPRIRSPEQRQIRSPGRPNPNNWWEQGFKMKIPQFDDSLKPEDFIDWLSHVEKILDFKEVPAERRVSLVTIRLHGRAQAWWQQLKKENT
ncbi:hypothetical protein CASFOL_014431 [Castilleja foliolosa]|uniref:Retrotransposon gag domain-containing protein n=1 Tax=Castilleja foliolosa TaxID=1961234 RepID=A0ABD3DRY2_9LAMI